MSVAYIYSRSGPFGRGKERTKGGIAVANIRVGTTPLADALGSG